MKIVNTLKKGVAYFGCLVALFFFVKSKTDGFTENRIYREEAKLCPEPNRNYEHRAILEQPFSYLGHGTQSYVLISDDGNYVLKFFRKDRATHPLKSLAFLLPSGCKNRLKKTLKKREKRMRKTFTSFQIALDHLRDQTGTIDFRLAGSSDQMLTFTDKIGVLHHMSLSGVPFLLQKKADPLYPTLLSWIQKGQIDTARQSLSELVHILKSRCEKGIFDKDANLKTNFGWIDGLPIQTDVGRFSIDEKRKDPDVYQRDLIRITDRLCIWLDKESPELANHLRQEVRAL